VVRVYHVASRTLRGVGIWHVSTPMYVEEAFAVVNTCVEEAFAVLC
jgi:hypothetical protein